VVVAHTGAVLIALTGGCLADDAVLHLAGMPAWGDAAWVLAFNAGTYAQHWFVENLQG